MAPDTPMAPYPNFAFEITSRAPESRAHTGVLTTPHGVLDTPNFIFCATKAAIKAVSLNEVKAAGADIILSNTYHLLLQPGADIVAKHGGLHRMMNWEAPMLTDSGGFQIFSLGHGGVAQEIKGNRGTTLPKTLLKINEEGATFRSYVDGSMHQLTPEISIDVQRKLGADLILVLDECTPFHSSRDYTARSMELSHRWARRSLAEFKRGEDGSQALYGIVQGGIYEDLRKESANFIAEQPFFGQAVGGSLGGDKKQMKEVVEMTMRYLNPNRPTHLLGIGGLADIWHGVAAGIDTFDCVHPTRLARHGGALIEPWKNGGKEHLNLKNARFREDTSPLDPESDFTYSRDYSKAYIHHLLKANEAFGGIILTLHNIHFMARLAKRIRDSIRNGTFAEEHKRWTST